MSSGGKTALKVIGIFACLFIILRILMMIPSVRESVFNSALFSQNYRYLSVILPLGLSIVTAYLGHLLAERRERSRKLWTAACFFFQHLGAIGIVFPASTYSQELKIQLKY
jgi:hypothetical protein